MNTDNATAEAIQAHLDNDLSGRDKRDGVMFGQALFFKFMERGWITQEKFGAEGTPLFAHTVPAYDKTHLAILNWAVPDLEYRVGGRIDA